MTPAETPPHHLSFLDCGGYVKTFHMEIIRAIYAKVDFTEEYIDVTDIVKRVEFSIGGGLSIDSFNVGLIHVFQ